MNRVEPIVIRRAGEPDVPRLADLGARAFVAAFGSANPAGVAERYAAAAFSNDTVASQVADPGSTWLVAETGDRLLGMAHLVGGDAPAEVTGECPVQLSRLYTDPMVTNAGVGSRLLQVSLDLAAEDGHDVMWLGVWEHNPRAVAFYERWGFEQVGTVVFRLGDEDQTDFVMARSVG